MRITHIPQKTTLAFLIASIWIPSAVFADQINLVQYPAGTAYKAPIPNVVLTVDTSGSMGSYDGHPKTRLQYAMEGLESVLVNSTKYDDQIRLAWQSFACNNIPSSSGGCNGKNAMGKFSGAHKTDFQNWVTNLTSSGYTPSHVPIWNAGEYMKVTGANSPWNATPGTSDNDPLTCRRAYHIFLTDGGWNYGTPSKNYPPSGTGFAFESTIKASNSYAQTLQNADGKNDAWANRMSKFSDAPSSDQTTIYEDTYGTRKIQNYYDGQYYAYPTLADLAYYYWATDLQPSIADGVLKKIRKTGSETFTANSKSVTFNEDWNPRNDPATWQHLVQYTIGYGPDASVLGDNTSTSPNFTGGTYGMYDTGFSELAVGSTKWDNVTGNSADNNYDAYRPQEMWHMAINSRGKFYPVNGGDLTGVFTDIFDDIIVDTSAPISGFTSASGSVSRVGTQSYQTTYIAADDPHSNDNRWYGYVTSDSIATDGSSTPNSDWGLNGSGKNKTTADMLDALTNLNSRLILTYNIASSPAKGIPFKWANISNSSTGASQKMWLNNGSVGSPTSIAGDGKGQDRLNFLRGDRSKEIKNSGTFRNRKTIQGDIVDSAIWFTGAPASGYPSSSYATFAKNYATRLPMIYVGGNDGMLHGFSAKTGAEKIAYVPHGVFQNLSLLTKSDYTHQYYVDGSPFSGDINLGTEASPDWRTYLIGTLAAGGRGYFVLDVTKPGSATGSAVTDNFTEGNATTLVVMDKTAASVGEAAPPGIPADANADPYIGHIFGNPVVAVDNQQHALQITKTNNGRWALITGNGYNSANEKPALLIQYLDGDKSLQVIPTPDAACPTSIKPKGNGLSTPQLLDVNGDGIPDFVYAGDLCGNMWKFDISNYAGTIAANGIADTSNWGVAFSGDPLFTAATSSTTRQPITAPAVLRVNRDVGGLMVAFGTGQNLTEDDRTDTSQQTVYSILDNTRYEIESTGPNKGKVKVKASNPTPTTVSGRSDLQAESVTGGTGSGTAGTGTSATRSFWKLSTTQVTYACAASATGCTVKQGWYMDLPVAGERVTTSFDFYDGSSILEIISEKPASGSATASGDEVCAPQPQAAKPFRTLININSGKIATPPILDVNGDGVFNATDAGYARMTASSKELRFTTKTLQVRKGNDGTVDKMAKLPELLVRPGWRQLK